jgi:DNA polymerase I-like protein with 3'-5' exonuclease and polymerase domains
LRGFSLKCIEIEQDVQKCISEQIRNGVYVDEEKVNALYTETKRRADLLEREIRTVFGPSTKLIREYNPKEKKDGSWSSRTVGTGFNPNDVGGPFSYFCYEPFNLDSPQQRVERLLKVGWVPTEFTPTGAPKFSEEALEHLPADAPQEVRLLGQYLMCRSRQRLAIQLIDLSDSNGFVHGYVNTLGAATHRMSSSAPNLQNIPKASTDKSGKPIRGLDGGWGWECRDVFTVVPKSGNVLVDADASGIQLRGLAHYGGDKEYIRLVSDPKVDIHNVHAEVLQCNRSVAKTFIYALLMGAGVKKLASVLGSGDPKRGRELLDLFYVRFGFLAAFKDRLDYEVKKGYHIGLDGRLLRLDPLAPHKAMASALQSFETIVVKYAMTRYQRALRKDKIWYTHRLTVHDEFLAETHKKDGQVVGQAMVQAIENAGVELGSLCPLTGGYKIGTSWAQVH